jgi:hypothetical protein
MYVKFWLYCVDKLSLYASAYQLRIDLFRLCPIVADLLVRSHACIHYRQ